MELDAHKKKLEALAGRVAISLKALGSSSEKIAKQLKKLGVKGEPVNCLSCPISNYIIRKHKLKQKNVRIQARQTGITLEYNGLAVNVAVSNSLKKFIREFDESKHIDLFFTARKKWYIAHVKRVKREEANERKLKQQKIK